MKTGPTLSWFRRHPFASFVVITAITAAAGLLSTEPRVATGQDLDLELEPLSSVAVPRPIGGDMVDQAAAVRLGKALFWDVQLGGDGQTACATCHFHGGADNRPAANPGLDKLFGTADDVHGSMGLTVAQGTFKSIDSNSDNAADICTTGALNLFGVAPQATTRNGVAFFRQMFWDGRGNENFNGAGPFGQTANSTAAQKTSAAFSAVGIGNSALASQAVGPANKFPEVSCNGRTFGNLYDKLTARKVLQHQLVHQHDSALGAMSAWPAKGLKCGTDGHACGYGEMIAAAFGPSLAVKGQFSRVFGQAVQAYESTLIPDQTPLDRLLAGNSKAMTDLQKKGLSIFRGKGGCTKCHAGAELTDASWSFANTFGLINEDGGDQGFHNIGVRPTIEDLGRAGTGGANVAPFSVSGSVMDHAAFKTPALPTPRLPAPPFH